MSYFTVEYVCNADSYDVPPAYPFAPMETYRWILALFHQRSTRRARTAAPSG